MQGWPQFASLPLWAFALMAVNILYLHSSIKPCPGQMVTDTVNLFYKQSFQIVLAELSQNFRWPRSWIFSQIKFFQINSIFNCADYGYEKKSVGEKAGKWYFFGIYIIS